MFEFAPRGRPNIVVPAILIDTESCNIVKSNALYQNTYLSRDQQTQRLLILRIKEYLRDLESISFRYQLPTASGASTSMVWAQYTDIKREQILVLLDYKSCDALLPIDYYIISDLTPAGVAYISIAEDSYCLTYGNQHFIKMLGYEEDERHALIGHNVLDFLCKEDLLHIEQHRKVGNHNEPFDIPVTMNCKDGSLVRMNLCGRFVVPSSKDEILIVTVSPLSPAPAAQCTSFSASLSENLYSMIFRYDFSTQSISFLGGLLKKLTGKKYLTYHINDLYANRSVLKLDAQKLKRAISAAHKGKKEEHIFKAVGKGSQIYWLKVDYDFATDIEGKHIAIVGRAYDISEQQAAKEFYDKAISLWHMKYDDCESAITINVSEQLVVDGYSDLIPLETLHSMSMTEYLDSICSNILNKGERKRLRQQMTSTKLIAALREKNTRFSYDFEINHNGSHYWRRLNVTLIENPKTGDIMALLKWTNINDLKLYQRINHILLARNFDFICLVFAKSDSFSMILNAENTRIYPTSSVNGYESFVQDIIRQYSLPEDAAHLRFCFSLKNLKNQLSINSTYSFIGHGLYPDGSPTVKYHTFQYLDPKEQIILYTREDITNESEVLSFKVNSKIYSIPFKEILYVESFSKKSKVFTRTEEFEVNEMISSLQARLPGRIFTRCHRCYIVRNGAIKLIDKSCALLTNGSHIPISRKCIGFLREQSFYQDPHSI